MESLNPFRKVDNSEYTSEMPTYPGFILTSHVFIKGIQAGSCLSLVLGPIYAYARHRETFFRSFNRTLVISPIIGGIATSLLLLGKAYSDETLTYAGVDDRAFRLVNNEGQNRVDLYSAMGATAGIITAVVGRAPLGVVPLGIAAGVVASVAQKFVGKKD